MPRMRLLPFNSVSALTLALFSLPAAYGENLEDCVVRLTTQVRFPNPIRPWTRANAMEGSGTGVHIGGGRIVGEVCHFIDLARHLVGHSIVGHSVYAMALPTDHGSPDSVMISLQFADGSIASIQYLSNGSKAFPKERLEIFCDGKILALDNFRKLHAFGWTGFKSMHLLRQDKGQLACVQSFVKALERCGPPPIPFEELEEVARVTLEIASEAH